MNEEKEPTNLKAPYKVYTDKTGNIYSFQIQSTEYRVLFLESNNLLEDLPLYSIVIDRSFKDSTINPTQTIIAIIKNLLDSNNVLCYTCDTEGDKQFARHRLFKQWFNNDSEADLYEMINIDAIGDICGGLIIKKSHPLYSIYLKETESFKSIIKDLK